MNGNPLSGPMPQIFSSNFFQKILAPNFSGSTFALPNGT
jgi:hypothetical protein